MSQDIEKRLIDLEIRYTHQEELLKQLNEVVGNQSRIVDRLNKELKELKLSSVSSQESLGNERPPHY